MRCGLGAHALLVVAGIVLGATAADVGIGSLAHQLAGDAAGPGGGGGEAGARADLALLGAIRARRQQQRQARQQAAQPASGATRRRRPRTYNRMNHAEWVHEWTNDLEFRRCYGLDMDTFEAVLETIRADIEPPLPTRGGYRGERIPAEQKLAITLRWLRGSSYIDSTYMPRSYESKTSLYAHNRDVIRAINLHYGFPLRWQLTVALAGGGTQALDATARAFATKSDGCIDKCVGALDGVLVCQVARASTYLHA